MRYVLSALHEQSDADVGLDTHDYMILFLLFKTYPAELRVAFEGLSATENEIPLHVYDR